MDISDIFSTIAIALSCFTFYWTTIRKVEKLFLVRIDSYSHRMDPDFVIINAGNTDCYVTSVRCAFQSKKGLYSPDVYAINDGDFSFTLAAGESKYCSYPLNKEVTEDLRTNLSDGMDLQSGDSVVSDLVVIVEWVNRKGKEYRSEPRIIHYEFKNDYICSDPLKKKHDLYKDTRELTYGN